MDAQTVAAIARRELGENATLVDRFEDGLKHATYEVSDGDDEYVLQFADADEVSDLRRGLGCYRLLADTEIPVPTPVTDRVRADSGGAYTVVEKLPGSNGERDDPTEPDTHRSTVEHQDLPGDRPAGTVPVGVDDTGDWHV